MFRSKNEQNGVVVDDSLGGRDDLFVGGEVQV